VTRSPAQAATRLVQSNAAIMLALLRGRG
jgi:hypothetical protein